MWENSVPSSHQWRVWVLPDTWHGHLVFRKCPAEPCLAVPTIVGGPSTPMKLPASSTLQTSSGEGYRAAKCLHVGPTQKPRQRKDWACNSNKCTITAKTSHWQQAQLCSPCSKRDVSRAAAIPASTGWSVAPDHHLLWVLVTLQERRQNRKRLFDFPFFHLGSASYFSPLFFLLPKLNFSDMQGGQLLLLHHWKVQVSEPSVCLFLRGVLLAVVLIEG